METVTKTDSKSRMMIFGDNFYVITTWVQVLVKKTIYDEFSCTLKQSFTIISKDANLKARIVSHMESMENINQ